MRVRTGWVVFLVVVLLLVLAGLSQGCARIYTEEEVTAAYERGYHEGFNRGYDKGYAKGYYEGYKAGSRAGGSANASGPELARTQESPEWPPSLCCTSAYGFRLPH